MLRANSNVKQAFILDSYMYDIRCFGKKLDLNKLETILLLINNAIIAILFIMYFL